MRDISTEGFRITPAYAGKSMYRTTETLCCKDHPRVCGEKPSTSTVQLTFPGSPPRMRGKVIAVVLYEPLCRITPAYAGKRVQVPPPDNAPRDHPRVCGEKPDCKAKRNPRKGSPPRMRGKERGSAHRALPLGITPAYAGKSGFSGVSASFRRDHPRVCGEKTKKIP